MECFYVNFRQQHLKSQLINGVKFRDFIRRFMRSRIAKRLDDGSVLESNIQAEDILQLVNEEYGFSNYGSVKYTRNEMYWIGYIYRYFVITYELTSMQVYKIVKPKELKGLFCHIIQWIHLRLLSEYWKQKACLPMKNGIGTSV